MDTSSTAHAGAASFKARQARAARLRYACLAALVLVIAITAAVKLTGSDQDGAAGGFHQAARQSATVEAAHEAALVALKQTERYVRRERRWPQSLAQAGHVAALPDPVAAIEIAGGAPQAIAVRFKAPAAGYSLRYVRLADVENNDGDWVCDAAGMPEHAVPPDCQATAMDANEIAVIAINNATNK